LKLSNISTKNVTKKKKKIVKVQLQAVMFNGICYYVDEEANQVYNDNNKCVGVVCPITYELIPL
jgi:hypothetical protein